MTTMTTERVSLIPDTGTLTKLFLGGAIGLAIWEVWARVLTVAVLGYPLEPAGLIDAIANNLFGLQVPYLLREVLHYGVGIVGYPVAYYLISRFVPKWPLVLDAIVFVTFSFAYFGRIAEGASTPVMFIFYTTAIGLILTRFINKSELIANVITWGNFTWFNALGLMAPVFGGLSFYLMGEGGELSYMSFVGHVIYGAVAAYLFERWMGAKA